MPRRPARFALLGLALLGLALALAAPPALAQRPTPPADTLASLDVRLAEIVRGDASLASDLGRARGDVERVRAGKTALDVRRDRLDVEIRLYQEAADRHRAQAAALRQRYDGLRRDGGSAATRQDYEAALVRLEADGVALTETADRLTAESQSLATAYQEHAVRSRDLVARAQSLSQQRSALRQERETLEQRRQRLAARR